MNAAGMLLVMIQIYNDMPADYQNTALVRSIVILRNKR